MPRSTFEGLGLAGISFVLGCIWCFKWRPETDDQAAAVMVLGAGLFGTLFIIYRLVKSSTKPRK